MNTTTKPLKQSETRTILRSQINLNPHNPKRHGEDKVRFQKKNLKDFGFVGGIVWNERTGNLIDGHRRIMAMDEYFGYDGSQATDYEVKVEAVDVDEQSEKEQMTYMALGNTKADISLVADYINDIDPAKIGVDKNELDAILALSERDLELPDLDISEIDLGISARDMHAAPAGDEPDDDTPGDGTPGNEQSYEERKAAVKAAKQATSEKAQEASMNDEAFITLSFSTYDAKQDFCELIGVDPDDKYAKGEQVLAMIE